MQEHKVKVNLKKPYAGEELRNLVENILKVEIHRNTLNGWITRGLWGVKLNARRIGKRWFVTGEDVLKFILQSGQAGRALRDKQAEPTDANTLEVCG